MSDETMLSCRYCGEGVKLPTLFHRGADIPDDSHMMCWEANADRRGLEAKIATLTSQRDALQAEVQRLTGERLTRERLDEMIDDWRGIDNVLENRACVRALRWLRDAILEWQAMSADGTNSLGLKETPND
jgi:hypothetical protein